jgi:hypothetical protein
MTEAKAGDDRAAWKRLLHSRDLEADYADIFDPKFIEELTDFIGHPATHEEIGVGLRELVSAYVTAKWRMTLRKPAKIEARYLHDLAEQGKAAAKALRIIEKRGNAALKLEHQLRRRLKDPTEVEASLLVVAGKFLGRGALVAELAALFEEVAEAARGTVRYGEDPDADSPRDLDRRMHQLDVSTVREEQAKQTPTYAVSEAVSAFQFTWMYASSFRFTEGTYFKGVGYISETLDLHMKIFARLDPEVRPSQVANAIRRIKNDF